MLIDSDFHDYYDTAMAAGIDKTCVYNRKRLRVDLPKSFDDRNLTLRKISVGHNDYNFVYWRIIGFAGEIFPLVTITDSPIKYGKPFYDWESASQHLDKIMIGDYEREARYRQSTWNPLSDVSMKQFFEESRWTRLKEIFVKHRAPVFMIDFAKDARALTLNVCLKGYRFMTIKDPFTAFQEVHGFLSGVLGGLDRDVAVVNEQDRIKQRGFTKWSFRKEPRRGRK